ncbi:MAG: hypothetical protein NPIRA06_12280 [Nitrospirales bacterium]|nr:MAG: hypothetical protein NPIRA06_12280 [Nitrospirales bacterium]
MGNETLSTKNLVATDGNIYTPKNFFTEDKKLKKYDPGLWDHIAETKHLLGSRERFPQEGSLSP